MEADIHFKEAFAGWLGVVASPILPKHYLTDIPIGVWRQRSYPVSADLVKAVTLGPFKYASVTATTIELVRDDNWAGPAIACGDKACLDGVTFRTFEADREREIKAFVSGEIDVALGLTQGVSYPALDGLNAATGTMVYDPADWIYEHLDFNQAGLGQGRGHPALKDIRVRRAIAQAIDKKALWEAVFPGVVFPNNNPCTNAIPGNYWRLADAVCPPFDLAAANRALDDAGYKIGADGIRVDPRSGLPLVFEHCTTNLSYRVLASDFVAKSLEAIGIRLNVHAVDGNRVLFGDWAATNAATRCNLARGTYDTSLFVYVNTFDVLGNFFYAYHSSQVPTDANGGAGYNYVRLANDEMDAALDSLASAIAPEDQLEAVFAVQRVYLDQVPEVTLFYPVAARPVSARLHNFMKNPSTASDIWNIQDWWITP